MSDSQTSTGPSSTADKARTLSLFFFTVALACGALAFHYRRAQKETVARMRELEQASEASAQAGRPRGSAPGTTQDYQLLAQIARKDAVIAELRRKLGTTAENTAPVGSNPKPVSRSRRRIVEPEPNEQPAAREAPAPRAIGDLSTLMQFLGSVDTTRMNAQQFERHNRLVEQAGGVQKLLAQARETSDETQLRNLDLQIGNSLQSMTPMLLAERDALLFGAGLQLGYDESSAQWFVDFVKYAYEIVSPESVSNNVWRSGPAQ